MNPQDEDYPGLDDGIEPENDIPTAEDVPDPAADSPGALGDSPGEEQVAFKFGEVSAAVEGGPTISRGDTAADGGGEIPTITVDDYPPQIELFPTEKIGDDQPARMIVAIASGRGGAGKSLLAANIAVYLAQIGKRVVAVDADPAGGTLNHLLGTARPSRGFGSYLRGRAENLEELAIDTPVAGVRLIAGEALPFGSTKTKLTSKVVLTALQGIVADTIVVDLGPPDSALCLDLWLGAHVPILVTLADSASIEGTYRFLKSAFLRQLRGERGLDKVQAQVGRPLPAALDLYRVALEFGRQNVGHGAGDSARAAQDDDGDIGATDATTPARAGTLGGGGLLKNQGKTPAVAAALAHAIGRFRPRFVVAQTRSLGDTKLGPQMSMAAHRRLGHAFDYLGHVESDETVAAATRRHRPVMAEFPEAKVCRNIEKIVRRILSAETERPAAIAPPRLETEQTFYEILETEPGVSDEEIRRAFRLCKEIYAVGSPVICGLYEEAELASFHDRVNAAHDTLFAPERRRLYDLSLPEADLARAVRRAAKAPRAEASSVTAPTGRGNVPPLDADAEVSGATLKRVRESRGMELSEVAQRTKISERHLRSIEDERFDELPAPVYVRGFVAQMARILQIDPARAADTYLRRFHGAIGPGGGTPALKEL